MQRAATPLPCQTLMRSSDSGNVSRTSTHRTDYTQNYSLDKIRQSRDDIWNKRSTLKCSCSWSARKICIPVSRAEIRGIWKIRAMRSLGFMFLNMLNTKTMCYLFAWIFSRLNYTGLVMQRCLWLSDCGFTVLLKLWINGFSVGNVQWAASCTSLRDMKLLLLYTVALYVSRMFQSERLQALFNLYLLDWICIQSHVTLNSAGCVSWLYTNRLRWVSLKPAEGGNRFIKSCALLTAFLLAPQFPSPGLRCVLCVSCSGVSMSLQWTAVATFLYIEVFFVLLLCIPFISPKRSVRAHTHNTHTHARTHLCLLTHLDEITSLWKHSTGKKVDIIFLMSFKLRRKNFKKVYFTIILIVLIITEKSNCQQNVLSGWNILSQFVCFSSWWNRNSSIGTTSALCECYRFKNRRTSRLTNSLQTPHSSHEQTSPCRWARSWNKHRISGFFSVENHWREVIQRQTRWLSF